MYVITVAPLKRGNQIDTLSYFSAVDYKEGTILTVPIRNKEAFGLVIKSQVASNAKTALRAATFSLKKLPIQEKPPQLSEALIQTAKEMSTFYDTPLGTILYNLLPSEIRNGEIEIPHTHHIDHTETHAPEILHAHEKDRFLAYRSLVRSTFAHSGSVLIVVPASADAQKIEEELGAGIEDRVITLTSALTNSQIRKSYEALDDFSKTKLIIATPTHALIERHDVLVTVVENERSSYFKQLNRPYLDYRDVLMTHAKHSGRRIILADLLPRTEEEMHRRTDTYGTFGETPKRIELKGKMEVVDMNPKNNDTEYEFKLLSEELIKQIKETRKRKGNTFLFSPRRGLAPMVTCRDCAYVFRSKESGAPYSLIRTGSGETEERWFVCSASGEKIRAADVCPLCGSWRLRERGVGIQQVHDEVRKLFPNAPVLLFDHISAKTYKKATFLRDTFYKSKGAILLGTQMAIPYLVKPVMLSSIINMDSLLATPTWRLEEDNLALLLSLREKSTEKVIVQARTTDFDVLKYAKQGMVEQFYNEELELRKSFKYPPYATFIHFTWQGKEEEVKTIEQSLKDTFEKFKIQTYPSPTAPKGARIAHGLIRVKTSLWPNKELSMLIQGVHPSVRIVINPDRIV